MARHRRQPVKDSDGNEDQWNLTDHVSGYIRPRNGIAVVHFDRYKKSLGIPFEQRLKSRAVKAANIWVTELKKRRSQGVPVATPKLRTARSAWDEFLTARVDMLSESRQESYDAAAAAFFVGPLPLELDALHTAVLQWLSRERAKGLAHNTIALKASCLKTFFRYCRNRGLLHGDPMAETGAPKLKARERIEVYTEEEIARVERRLLETARTRRLPAHRRPAEQAAIAWKWLYYTGMREGELLKLRWDAIEMTGSIDDKIVLTKTKTGRDRFFPLAPFPEVRELIERLRPYRPHNKGKLFIWKNPARLLAAITSALTAEGIRYGTTPIHAMRATCAQRLRRLGIAEEYIPTIIGNDVVTYRRFYKDLPVEELSETIERTRERMSQQMAAVMEGRVVEVEKSST